MITIRPASPEDAAALAELRWEFRAGRDPAVETHDAFVERCTAWMRRELSIATAWRAWVAVRGPAIVGQVWLQTFQKLPNPSAERERHAYLSNLYVQPAERGGAGTPLLEAAIAWARANEMDYVILWPSARSVTLYERAGFTHRGRVMELKC
ncbi:MAG: GNAT family N-acetyltransferase [Acidobacteria bacterium]|nr:GNAT family N-acetyltransferase [Acidobacteriota bacterium]